MWRHIRSDQAHVTNAEEYAAIARQRCPSIHISYIKREQIESLKPFLEQKWSIVVAVPRTHQTHCFKTSSKVKLMVADISISTAFRIVCIRKASSDDEDESSIQSDKSSGISIPKLNFSEYVRHRTLTSISTHSVTEGSRFYIQLSRVDRDYIVMDWLITKDIIFQPK